MSLLDLRGITHWYARSSDPRPVLDNVDVSVETNGIVAVVGESGCGKTTVGRVVAGLLQPTRGQVRFEDRDVWSLGGGAKKRYRRSVQLIHQDPYASLNPGLTIADALGAALLYHGMAQRKNLQEKLLRALREVGLDATPAFLGRYPHQLSGGQRQRVAIARAMSLQPSLVVADEATSMLDVSMRVAILDLLLSLKAQRELAYLFVSHDFGVVRYFARGGRTIVMLYGAIVEEGPTEDVIRNPRHPYTYLLLQAVPVPDPFRARDRGKVPVPIEADRAAQGCAFANRCPFAEDKCRTAEPPPVEVGAAHRAKCWFPDLVAKLITVSEGVTTHAENRSTPPGDNGHGHVGDVRADPAGEAATG